MTTWPKEELRKISESDDLHISPFREDGVTYGTPTWICSVTVGDALYVRGYNGTALSLVQGGGAAESSKDHRGRIDAGGHVRESGRRDRRPHRRRLPGKVP